MAASSDAFGGCAAETTLRSKSVSRLKPNAKRFMLNYLPDARREPDYYHALEAARQAAPRYVPYCAGECFQAKGGSSGGPLDRLPRKNRRSVSASPAGVSV